MAEESYTTFAPGEEEELPSPEEVDREVLAENKACLCGQMVSYYLVDEREDGKVAAFGTGAAEEVGVTDELGLELEEAVGHVVLLGTVAVVFERFAALACNKESFLALASQNSILS